MALRKVGHLSLKFARHSSCAHTRSFQSRRLSTHSLAPPQSIYSLSHNLTSHCTSNSVRRYTSYKMESFLCNQAFINGKFQSVSETFPVLNPFTDKKLGDVANCTASDAVQAIEVAAEAFKTWKKTTPKERATVLRKWSELMIKNKQALAELITAENGKPVAESIGEINYAAYFFEWCAEEAKRTYGKTIPTPFPNKRLMSIKQPIGVTGMITPWNFPSAMITRKAGAAIAAGCTVVLKPSEDTPYSALALAKLSLEAGLPPGVLNILPCSRENTPAVGQVICESPKVAAISFTGSTATGKILLKQSANTVKKVLLELGGLAPFIVFESADVENAVKHAMACKFRYMGQTCVCANRIFVQESVHDEFVSKFVAAMKKELKMGDPMVNGNTFGPLINEKAVLKVEDQLADAVKLGAKIEVGGKRGQAGKSSFEPTLLTNVTSEMKCFNFETFGPIASIRKFKTEEEVLALANDTRSGLAGYFFSNDVSQCFRVAEEIEVGMIGINEGIFSTAEAPFGGVKESGLGREGSSDGLDEFMEIKYMCWAV
uniref:Succinate-semialdehyde dehydrogenase n=1 Tax=Phallusia mammillata TaxID=59560 RepID=A0A6F9D720_9ASCI|nr:succinate-semialdehyde dehydrogenase, mitochondrial [Phallusia mammillata]